MPFSFGTNWARFSEFAGGIFGTALAFEAITAFTLEAVFLGILVFGRKLVSKWVFFLSAFFVFFGSHLSAFWIISVNSWMQTPAGFAVENGRAVLVSLKDVVFNPSTIVRFLHVVTACWLSGAVLAAGIAAYFIRKGRTPAASLRLFVVASVIAAVAGLAQPLIGHQQIMSVLHTQPEKDAAYEGIFKTVEGAPLIAFGIPDQENRTIHFAFGMPYMLSFLESWDFKAKVKGLEEYPEKDWPPVNVIFTTFHIMVPIGMVLLATGLLSVYFIRKKTVQNQRWLLTVLTFIIPLPLLANEMGWIGAEVGRQPWVIYKVLRTDQAYSSVLSAGEVAFSLTLLVLIYLALSVLAAYLLRRVVTKGIEE